MLELDYTCPTCGAEYVLMTDEEKAANYCPFCGSDEQEEW
jgi:DNA-directed RNA polymerase subunit RPC12/RpoP|tara:strand:+ start:170 stop:289 length:120 start_codon:yes stop_codon:yes gene_type:complete